MYAVISGLSLQCSNPYTTHQSAYVLLVNSYKSILSARLTTLQISSICITFVFSQLLSEQDHLIMLIVQTNVSDL